MKKLLGLTLLAAIFLCLGTSSAKAAVTTTYSISVSTPTDTPILLVPGSGALWGVDCSSGTTSGFVAAFDKASTSGVTVGTQTNIIIPQIYSSGQTIADTLYGYWRAPTDAPVQFINGLVGLTHGAAINCQFRVGPANGS